MQRQFPIVLAFVLFAACGSPKPSGASLAAPIAEPEPVGVAVEERRPPAYAPPPPVSVPPVRELSIEEALALPVPAPSEDIYDEVFPAAVLELPPSFPGGQDSLMAFIARERRYPEAERAQGITGRVFVSFEVDTLGRLADIQMRANAPAFEQEARRIVGLMPLWQPGQHRGKTVRSRYTFVLRFE